jgi:voltage-gated potassium channel Kch
MPNKIVKMDMAEARKIHREFQLLALLSLTILAFGTIVFHYLEKWSWVDSFYFSAVSLTTVGYGDITPTTDSGKIIAVLYLLTGIGVIAAMINNLVKNQAAKRKIKEHEQNNKLDK